MGKLKTVPLVFKSIRLWLVPFFTDFGFKAAWVKCKLFPKVAIQEMLGFNQPITELTMIRNEILPLSKKAKGGIYDVICVDERKRVYIIEMQAGSYRFFKKRLLFYIFQEYCSLVPRQTKKRKSFKNVPELYCICFVKDRILAGEDYYNKFMWRNDKSEIFDAGVQIHLFELGKFKILQHEAHKVTTNIEKLLFTMKYAHLFQPKERPAFMDEDWLSDSIEELDMSKLDPQQRVFLEYELAKEADIRESYELDMEESFEKGVEEGIEKGVEKKTEEFVLRLHENGLVNDLIAKFSGASVAEVGKILAKHNKKPHLRAKNGKSRSSHN